MEAVNGLKKTVKAKFKGHDTLKKYIYGETYLLNVEEHDGDIIASLATGEGKRTYKEVAEYEKDWEELEVQSQSKPAYYLTLTYNEDGSPKLDHKNSGMREADIITCLEIAKLHLLQEITGRGSKK